MDDLFKIKENFIIRLSRFGEEASFSSKNMLIWLQLN